MLLVAPLVLVASAFAGYRLSANALRPVQGIIDELAAITDGRSPTAAWRCRSPATRSRARHRRSTACSPGSNRAQPPPVYGGCESRAQDATDGAARRVERLTDPRTPTEVMASSTKRWARSIA
jgi:hypothetical protein